jgi:alkylation response protein AidB-like acyl-CoA dehydrogenase
VDVLEQALAFLREEVAPRAQDIDQDVEVLRDVLREMCRRGLMALKCPAEYGGPSIDEPGFRRFQEESARSSGSFAFLQTQHQSAVAMLAGSSNDRLKDAYLPLMADGRKLVGIGFSQLRRPGPPMMRAEKYEAGYVLDGEVPWVTGWSFFPEFLAGATLPDGQAMFAVVPLPVEPLEGVTVSEPMKLAAMETAQTVSVKFSRFFVGDEALAFIRPTGWIRNSDMINIALQGHFAIGLVEAAIDVLRLNATKKPAAFLSETVDRFELELRALRDATAEAQKSADEETTDERLSVRAWAIDLAARASHASVAASSGAANSIRHPAQRIYREAIVYTVSAQTAAIMEATLRRLVR